jgi:hypothetical protein
VIAPPRVEGTVRVGPHVRRVGFAEFGPADGRPFEYFCRDCTMCWHPEFGQLNKVDPEICPGCGLATTACFERFERPAILTV